MLTYNPSGWVRNVFFSSPFVLTVFCFLGAFGLVWFVNRPLVPINCAEHRTNSSAKDQLTGVAVAVKKIMKPFSTPVLAKRTYRELKLLKHIQHENVCTLSRQTPPESFIHTYLYRLSV